MGEEFFMLDSSKTDGSAETVMDYVLSYTLRSVNNSKLPIFSKYARKILFKLIEVEDISQSIERVEVWKQWGEGHKKMDLTVEIDISQNSEVVHHALLIEDKYYSGIRYDNNLKTRVRDKSSRSDVIGDPTVADAILDRIAHSAHSIELTGESVRKIKASAK